MVGAAAGDGPDATSRVGDLHDVVLDFVEESGGGL